MPAGFIDIDRPAIACFGAAHIDQKAMSQGSIMLGMTNPVTIRSVLGGAACNVASNLTLLGCRATPVTMVGRDANGDMVERGLAERGMATDFVGRTAIWPTATHIAVMEPDGRTVLSLAEKAIYSAISPEALARAVEAVSGHTVWFVDADLPIDALIFLLDRKPDNVVVAMDAVTRQKAANVVGLLPRIDILFIKEHELGLLSGIEILDPALIQRAADRMLDEGTRVLVVDGGLETAYVGADSMEMLLPPLDLWVRDETGAGDSLIAGFLYGYVNRHPLDICLRLGRAAQHCTYHAEATIDFDLSSHKLSRMIGFDDAA